MAEPIELNQGSIEVIAVDVNDRRDRLADLSAASPRYHVRLRGAETWVIEDGIPNIDPTEPMIAECLVDTTALTGEYELYLSFDVLPQIPRLGPFRFNVNA